MFFFFVCFFVYSAAITPSGEIEVLMKDITVTVCRCVISVCVTQSDSLRRPGIGTPCTISGISFSVHYEARTNRQDVIVLTWTSYPHE